MLMLNPAASPMEVKSAYTLLEIIANPDRAKKHLDNLIAEKAAANEARDNAHKLVVEAKEKQASADAKHAELLQLIAQHDREHAARAKQLEQRHKALTATEARLTAKEADIASREQELIGPLASRADMATTREANLDAREAKLSALEQAASDMQQTYEARLAALKQAMGG